jgi:hypothetical protein
VAEQTIEGARTTGSAPALQRSDLAKRLKKPGSAPPHLRAASRPTQSCGSCKYFKPPTLGGGPGKCRLYEGYPVRSSQVCDSYAAG